jgi:hypothetical protein
MNINRTFSIPVSLAIKLKTERNQSKTVSRAVQKYLNDREEFSPADIPFRQLLAAIHVRSECPDHLKSLILHELTKK